MKKTKQTSTKLIVIAITTAAVIAAVTATSLSAARPAFAKLNCNETITICSGGSGCGPASECPAGTPYDVPGGGGSRFITGPAGNVVSSSGGQGGQAPTTGGGTLVGGGGHHSTCDAPGSCDPVGGSGQHIQGPGGNSDK